MTSYTPEIDRAYWAQMLVALIDGGCTCLAPPVTDHIQGKRWVHMLDCRFYRPYQIRNRMEARHGSGEGAG